MFKNLIPMLITSFAITICSQVFGQGGFGEADANDDKKVDAKELKEYASGKLRGFDKFDELFKELDADQDGSVSEKEFENRMTALRKVIPGQSGAQRRPGAGNQRNQRQRSTGLKVGDVAPTFKLKSLDGKSETDLATYQGKRPVVLIFGSYS